MSASGAVQIKKILVPIDGSKDSKKAQAKAVAIAKAYSASLLFVNVISGHALATSQGADDFEGYMESDGGRLVKAAEDDAKSAGLDASGEVVRAPGNAIGAIVDTATKEKVDLIVIGTRGLGGFKKMLMGSVSSGVASHAPCPVMVVR